MGGYTEMRAPDRAIGEASATSNGRLSSRRAEAGTDVRGDPAEEARLLRQGAGGPRGPVQRGGDSRGPVRPADDCPAPEAQRRLRRGSVDQEPEPRRAGLFDLRDGWPLPLAAWAD